MMPGNFAQGRTEEAKEWEQPVPTKPHGAPSGCQSGNGPGPAQTYSRDRFGAAMKRKTRIRICGRKHHDHPRPGHGSPVHDQRSQQAPGQRPHEDRLGKLLEGPRRSGPIGGRARRHTPGKITNHQAQQGDDRKHKAMAAPRIGQVRPASAGHSPPPSPPSRFGAAAAGAGKRPDNRAPSPPPGRIHRGAAPANKTPPERRPSGPPRSGPPSRGTVGITGHAKIFARQASGTDPWRPARALAWSNFMLRPPTPTPAGPAATR